MYQQQSLQYQQGVHDHRMLEQVMLQQQQLLPMDGGGQYQQQRMSSYVWTDEELEAALGVRARDLPGVYDRVRPDCNHTTMTYPRDGIWSGVAAV
jgi:hypothetical protein